MKKVDFAGVGGQQGSRREKMKTGNLIRRLTHTSSWGKAWRQRREKERAKETTEAVGEKAVSLFLLPGFAFE